MLEHLFGSQTRLKLLTHFFRNPNGSFFVRELTRALDTQINAVRRELQHLVAAGLIEEITVTEKDAHQFDITPGVQLRKYYRLNRASMIYPELQALLMKAQVVEEQTFVQELKEKAGNLSLLVLSGSFTGDMRAPTDLLMVGNNKEKAILRLIESYEKENSTAVRFTFMTEKEFFDRRHVMDKFLFTLFEAEHLKVVNTLGV